jgi:hypothetical protein
MKKLTLTLALGILLLNVSAFGRMSELNLRLHNYAGFNVVFDNQVVYNNTSSYDFINLTAGYHFLKVTEMPVTVYGNRGAYHNNPRVIYSGNIYIGADRKVYAMIDAYNRFVVIREDIFRNDYGYNNHNKKYDDSYNHYNHNHDKKYNNKYDDGYKYNDRYYGKSNCYAMAPNDFYALKNTIANAKFESTRFSIAKSAVSLNCFTSQQIHELLYLFTFESTRVDFAKLAYYSVIDKERFYLVYDAFTFSSSIDELSRFISRY